VSRIRVVQLVSLDGVVQAPGQPREDPDGEFEQGGWASLFVEDHRRCTLEALQSARATLLGRLTYEIFASYWPSARADP
jgi:hypothetical protein